MSSRLISQLRFGERIVSKCCKTRTISSNKHFSDIKCELIQKGATKMPVITAVIAHRHISHHQRNTQQQKPLLFHQLAITANTKSSIALGNYQGGRGGTVGSIKSMPLKMNKACVTSDTAYSNSLDLTQLGQQLLFNKECRRFYSKGKDRPKTKKSVVVINESEMNELIDYNSFKNQLDELIVQMKDEFSKQLSIRGTSGALEILPVEFDGETYPLQELAQVGRKNPQLVVLNLSSLPDACQAVIKALQESGMNLNPQQEGTTIYVPLPKVTREHRENLAKNAKTLFTKFKSSLQNVQNRFIKQCKSQEEMSQDLIFSVQQQITKLTESYILEAEKLLQSKQKELLENK